MFTRSILIPSIIVCVIAAPILFCQSEQGTAPDDLQNGTAQQTGYDNFGNAWLTPAQSSGRHGNTFLQTNSANHQTAPIGDPIFQQANSHGNPASIPEFANRPARINPSLVRQSPVGSGLPINSEANSATLSQIQRSTLPTGMQFTGMTPDYGAAQTLIYPGNAEGPDLTAAPMEFMPVTNFEEIFRFDVSPSWIKSRWKRVSTSPGGYGLHGLRVALVTGTNSWDLHGSLTYYFDGNHQPQRITLRGWTGDSTKLTNLLTQRFGFEKQPSHWAGFYLAKKKRDTTGGILMQHPTVIYRENTVQQVAIVLEINNPQGKFVLSNEFRSLIVGSQNTH